jgi:polyphosphate kinase
MEVISLNRELSWIDFNRRVLEEGLRSDLPPLERFRFLSIVSSNFDEFFMVRMAAMKEAGLTSLLHEAGVKVHALIAAQYRCLQEEIFPALQKNGIFLLRPEELDAEQSAYLKQYFFREIYPLLTPLRLDAERHTIEGAAVLYAAFQLKDANDDTLVSIVQFPPLTPRIIPLLPRPGMTCLALLDDALQAWGGQLFPGYRVVDSMIFKLNRDADFSVDERRDEDFIEAMEEVLLRRETSKPIRMVYTPGSPFLQEHIAAFLGLDGEDADYSLYEAPGPPDLPSLDGLLNIPGFESLRLPQRHAYPHQAISNEISLFEQIRAGDIMLHLPYQSFDPVLRFFREAASDPAVLSIKATLYRTSGESPIVRALKEAALKGKQVTAVVELKARFDEGRNISWARDLERAGVIVVYGLARFKVHAKLALVMRREEAGSQWHVRRYLHLSTGNYNDRTARLYEDIGLFTARKDVVYDAGLIFNMISGYSAVQNLHRLVMAPTGLRGRLISLIEREAALSSPENPGRIRLKLNALDDPALIEALYKASVSGVHIDLCVRGVCTLVPGLEGLSKHIRVRCIIGQYLEHSRIAYFANGGASNGEYYLSSADWMPRNMDRRIELMIPVLDETLCEELENILDAYFRDNTQAWEMDSSGHWQRLKAEPGTKPFSAQACFGQEAAEDAKQEWKPGAEFLVRRSALLA